MAQDTFLYIFPLQKKTRRNLFSGLFVGPDVFVCDRMWLLSSGWPRVVCVNWGGLELKEILLSISKLKAKTKTKNNMATV